MVIELVEVGSANLLERRAEIVEDDGITEAFEDKRELLQYQLE